MNAFRKPSLTTNERRNLAKTQMASIPAELPTRVYTTADTRFRKSSFFPTVPTTSGTNAGGGYSHWKNLAITRWKPDTTQDNWGTFFYLRDLDDGDFWSTAYQPVKKESARYETIFSEGRAEYRCIENGIETHCEVVVSPEDDIELRASQDHEPVRQKARTIELTSYSETVIATAIADLSHPAFSKLFVQTEIVPEFNAIISTRRPRFETEKPPFAVCHDGHS